MSKYDKWYLIGKLLCSTFRICKKISKFAKLNFYPKIQLYSKNVCKKKICPKNEKLYIFEKPLTMPFQICKTFCKILNNLIFNQEKLKMCKFPLTGCLQKICNFFRKTCAIRFLMSKAFQEGKFYQIWQVEVGQNKDLVSYRKKQLFRQCAWGIRQVVLKPGFRPKGRAMGM